MDCFTVRSFEVALKFYLRRKTERQKEKKKKKKKTKVTSMGVVKDTSC